MLLDGPARATLSPVPETVPGGPSLLGVGSGYRNEFYSEGR